MPDESRISFMGLDLADGESYSVVSVYEGEKLLTTFRGKNASAKAKAYAERRIKEKGEPDAKTM